MTVHDQSSQLTPIIPAQSAAIGFGYPDPEQLRAKRVPLTQVELYNTDLPLDDHSPPRLVSRQFKVYREKLYDLYLDYGLNPILWFTYDQYSRCNHLLRTAEHITGSYYANRR